MATQIRCTVTPNQLKRIFIYSFVGIEYLINNEYFNILKTKNVELVNYSKIAFRIAVSRKFLPLNLKDLPVEIKKLELEPPKNYSDNHSIANEWGIYQMARNANININEVEGFDTKKLSSLYFKWLIIKNQLDQPISQEQEQVQKRYAESLPGIKVLGKIDLTKFKK